MKIQIITMFILLLLMTSCAKSDFNSIPEDVIATVESYLNAMKIGSEESIQYCFFKEENNATKQAYLRDIDILLSYEITKIEKINDNLYACTILYEMNSEKGNYRKAYNYVGYIDNDYYFIVNERDIPDEIRENFNAKKYAYSGSDVLD